MAQPIVKTEVAADRPRIPAPSSIVHDFTTPTAESAYIQVEDLYIISGNFCHVRFANGFKLHDGLQMHVVALEANQKHRSAPISEEADGLGSVRTPMNRQTNRFTPYDGVSSGTSEKPSSSRQPKHEPLLNGQPVWEITLRKKPTGSEYDVDVRTIMPCTKMRDGCPSDLVFVGKPERQKSFRGQNLQYQSFDCENHLLGFKCSCTCSPRKGHYRAERFCFAMNGKLISQPFLIRGRPTGSKKPKTDLLSKSSDSLWDENSPLVSLAQVANSQKHEPSANSSSEPVLNSTGFRVPFRSLGPQHHGGYKQRHSVLSNYSNESSTCPTEHNQSYRHFSRSASLPTTSPVTASISSDRLSLPMVYEDSSECQNASRRLSEGYTGKRLPNGLPMTVPQQPRYPPMDSTGSSKTTQEPNSTRDTHYSEPQHQTDNVSYYSQSPATLCYPLHHSYPHLSRYTQPHPSSLQYSSSHYNHSGPVNWSPAPAVSSVSAMALDSDSRDSTTLVIPANPMPPPTELDNNGIVAPLSPLPTPDHDAQTAAGGAVVVVMDKRGHVQETLNKEQLASRESHYSTFSIPAAASLFQTNIRASELPQETPAKRPGNGVTPPTPESTKVSPVHAVRSSPNDILDEGDNDETPQEPMTPQKPTHLQSGSAQRACNPAAAEDTAALRGAAQEAVKSLSAQPLAATITWTPIPFFTASSSSTKPTDNSKSMGESEGDTTTAANTLSYTDSRTPSYFGLANHHYPAYYYNHNSLSRPYRFASHEQFAIQRSYSQHSGAYASSPSSCTPSLVQQKASTIVHVYARNDTSSDPGVESSTNARFQNEDEQDAVEILLQLRRGN